MSFDGAKVRRFLATHKHFWKIVHVNSPIFDSNQRIQLADSNILIFYLYLCTLIHYI